MKIDKLSPVQRQIVMRIANQYATNADLAAIRSLPSEVKLEIKAWLGTSIGREGVTDGEINERGRALDDLIDLIGD